MHANIYTQGFLNLLFVGSCSVYFREDYTVSAQCGALSTTVDFNQLKVNFDLICWQFSVVMSNLWQLRVDSQKQLTLLPEWLI